MEEIIQPHVEHLFVSLYIQVKMSRMRLRIAQRLKEAQDTCAMLTTFNEVDMRWAEAASEETSPTIFSLLCSKP